MKTIKLFLTKLSYFLACILLWLCLCAMISLLNQCSSNYEQKRCEMVEP